MHNNCTLAPSIFGSNLRSQQTGYWSGWKYKQSQLRSVGISTFSPIAQNIDQIDNINVLNLSQYILALQYKRGNLINLITIYNLKK